MKSKNKNPQDATLKNVRAAKKREGELQERIKKLEKQYDLCWTGVEMIFVELSEIWAAIDLKRKKGKK